jgi:glycosyltransferase involved in cell wall biosynthesis
MSRRGFTKPEMVSFVIPAWNEEAFLGQTLSALEQAAVCLQSWPHETIVVDDGSTDQTARIAREQGAIVLPVHHRQMAATRNAGAKVARGDLLVFVDADTCVNQAVLEAAIRALQGGAVGGSSLILFDGRLPLYAKALVPLSHIVRRVFRIPAGCFLFCRRDAFQTVEGFDEKLFAAEEVALGAALKRMGRFVILREFVTTSGRKLRDYSGWEMIGILVRLAWRGRSGMRSRKGLEIWYQRRGERR